jgi:GAF domain-containing protein
VHTRGAAQLDHFGSAKIGGRGSGREQRPRHRPRFAGAARASHGISDQFSRRIIGVNRDNDTGALPFDQPTVFSTIHRVPMLDEQLVAYREEGIASFLSAPLAIGGQGSGALVFYSRTAREFSDVEIHTARVEQSGRSRDRHGGIARCPPPEPRRCRPR